MYAPTAAAMAALTVYSIRKISSSRVEKRKQKKMAGEGERKVHRECKAIIQHNTLHRVTPTPHRTAPDYLFCSVSSLPAHSTLSVEKQSRFAAWIFFSLLRTPSSCNNIRFQNKPKERIIFFVPNASIRIDRHKIKISQRVAQLVSEDWISLYPIASRAYSFSLLCYGRTGFVLTHCLPQILRCMRCSLMIQKKYGKNVMWNFCTYFSSNLKPWRLKRDGKTGKKRQIVSWKQFVLLQDNEKIVRFLWNPSKRISIFGIWNAERRWLRWFHLDIGKRFFLMWVYYLSFQFQFSAFNY